MKKALFLSPVFAAILFTIPEAWQLMQRPDSSYIPVIYELLLFHFGYIAAFLVNIVVVLPLCQLVRLKTASGFAGILLAAFIALIGTTVAYAFEIFDYRSSILHPAYLYPVLLPLFVMSAMTFFYLARAGRQVPAPAEQPSGEDGPEGVTRD